MSFVEQSLSNQWEITVPAKLPMILKQFCKAAIRTQPYDLLKWSSSYFRALANGEEPPAKIRLEYPPPSTASGLTLGFLKVLLRQFGDYNKIVPLEMLLYRWECLCLDPKDLNTILTIGRFHRTCRLKNLLALAAGLLGDNLSETMIIICQLFTHEPDGGSAMLPFNLFMEMYGYLAGLQCDGTEKNLFENEDVMTDSRDISIVDSIYSVNNQAMDGRTDMDVNLDLQPISRHEVDPLKRDLSTEAIQPFEKKIDIDNEKAEDESLICSRMIKTKKRSDQFPPNGINDTINKISLNAKDTNSNRSVFSKTEDRDDTKLQDFRFFKYYPNVTGIGARLSAEQVANVATWMRECAKLQEGMVGPRNIRHMDCPRLYTEPTSEFG